MQQIPRSLVQLVLGRGSGLVLTAAAWALAGRTLEGDALARLFVALAVLQVSGLLGTVGFATLALTEHAHGRAFAPLARSLTAKIRRRVLLAALGFAAVLYALEGLADPLLYLLVPAHGLLLLQLAAVPELVQGRGAALATAELLARLGALAAAAAPSGTEFASSGIWALALASGTLLPPLLLALRLPESERRALWHAEGTRFDPAFSGPLRALVAGDLARALYLLGPHLVLRGMGVPSYVAFASAARLTSLAYLVPNSLSSLLLGPLGRLPAARAHALVLRLLPWLVVLGSGAALLLGLWAETWLRLFFPGLSQLATASHVLRLLAGTLPCVFVSSLLLPHLLARRCSNSVAALSLLGLGTLTVVLGAAALATGGPGAEAAALALLVTEAAVALGAGVLFACQGSSAPESLPPGP